jgi:hypothetical protein
MELSTPSMAPFERVQMTGEHRRRPADDGAFERVQMQRQAPLKLRRRGRGSQALYWVLESQNSNGYRSGHSDPALRNRPKYMLHRPLKRRTPAGPGF